jgi:hypothetical protein
VLKAGLSRTIGRIDAKVARFTHDERTGEFCFRSRISAAGPPAQAVIRHRATGEEAVMIPLRGTSARGKLHWYYGCTVVEARRVHAIRLEAPDYDVRVTAPFLEFRGRLNHQR